MPLLRIQKGMMSGWNHQNVLSILLLYPGSVVLQVMSRHGWPNRPMRVGSSSHCRFRFHLDRIVAAVWSVRLVILLIVRMLVRLLEHVTFRTAFTMPFSCYGILQQEIGMMNATISRIYRNSNSSSSSLRCATFQPTATQQYNY
jgi:hypothetical protein